MIRRALIGLIALVLLGGAVACGGDDGDGSAETDESAADAESTESDDESNGGDGDEGNGDGGLLGAVGGSDFCSQISAFGQDLQTDITAPNSFFGMIEQFVDIEPPEEIASQWELVFETAQGGADAAESMSDEERQQFQQAAQDIQTYIDENCG